MGIYTDQECTEPNKIDEILFVQGGDDSLCWAIEDNSSGDWGFIAVCEANSVGIHAFESQACGGTAYSFVRGVSIERARRFFAATGCEEFVPEPDAKPRYGRLTSALPVGSYPQCDSGAEQPAVSPTLSGASPKAFNLAVGLAVLTSAAARWR